MRKYHGAMAILLTVVLCFGVGVCYCFVGGIMLIAKEGQAENIRYIVVLAGFVRIACSYSVCDWIAKLCLSNKYIQGCFDERDELIIGRSIEELKRRGVL